MTANVSLLVVLATKSGNHKIRLDGANNQTLEDWRLRAWLGQFFGPKGFHLPDGQSNVPPESFHVDFFTLNSLQSNKLDGVAPLPAKTALGSLESKRVLIGVCSDIPNNAPTVVTAKMLAMIASNDADVQRELDDGHGDDGYAGPDVFISYSTVDAPIAEEFANELLDRGYKVFLAHKTISVGPNWEHQVFDAARSCRVAILVLSQNSRNSDWVRFEIGALVALGKHVAPALVGLDLSELPELVRKYQGRRVSSPTDRKAFCDEVARLLADR